MSTRNAIPRTSLDVERRGAKWRVRYLDAGGRHRSRAFDLKTDAQKFDQQVRRRKQRGTLQTLTAPAQTLDAYVGQYVGAGARVDARARQPDAVRVGL